MELWLEVSDDTREYGLVIGTILVSWVEELAPGAQGLL